MSIPIIPLGKHATQTASDLDKWIRPLRILRETVAYFPSLYSIYATFSIGFHNGLSESVGAQAGPGGEGTSRGPPGPGVIQPRALMRAGP